MIADKRRRSKQRQRANRPSRLPRGHREPLHVQLVRKFDDRLRSRSVERLRLNTTAARVGLEGDASPRKAQLANAKGCVSAFSALELDGLGADCERGDEADDRRLSNMF